MSASETEVWTPTPTEVVMVRTISAPREAVFRAWTNPEQLSQWWGPHYFTNPICELDVRPGGRLHIVMRSPEGRDYPVHGVYREVVEPERLVYTDSFEDLPAEWLEELQRHLPGDAEPLREVLVTVTFESVDSGTRLTVTTRFDSQEHRDAVLQMGATEGWSQSFERLEAVVGA